MTSTNIRHNVAAGYSGDKWRRHSGAGDRNTERYENEDAGKLASGNPYYGDDDDRYFNLRNGSGRYGNSNGRRDEDRARAYAEFVGKRRYRQDDRYDQRLGSAGYDDTGGFNYSRRGFGSQIARSTRRPDSDTNTGRYRGVNRGYAEEQWEGPGGSYAHRRGNAGRRGY